MLRSSLKTGTTTEITADSVFRNGRAAHRRRGAAGDSRACRTARVRDRQPGGRAGTRPRCAGASRRRPAAVPELGDGRLRLRAEDTPGRLPVVDRVAAGRPASRPLARGPGDGDRDRRRRPRGRGRRDSDRARRGHGRLRRGVGGRAAREQRPPARGRRERRRRSWSEQAMRLGAAQIGALAAAGIAEVVCARLPRVAVLTTGTELRGPGSRSAPGEIYESNGADARGAARRGGRRRRAARLRRGQRGGAPAGARARAGADVLVTSGGVSVGPHDLVRRDRGGARGRGGLLGRRGAGPESRSRSASAGATLVFGLPGNPVSSLVSCVLFVLPALRALQGERDPGPPYRRGRPRARDHAGSAP